MPFSVRILEKSNIVELRYEGSVNAEERDRARSDVEALFEQHGPMNVLVDMRDVKFDMSTVEIWDFASRIKRPVDMKITLLARPDDNDARFFETVAHNKGLCPTSFTDYSRALAFLTE